MIFALVVGPIVAGFVLFLFPRSAGATARLFGALVAFGACVLTLYARNTPDESVRWLSRPFAANFHASLGGAGFWIVMLLAVTTLCAIAVTNVQRERDFTAQMLLLLGAMTGVFVARDLLVFALFWDLMLLPVFVVLIGWAPLGPARSVRANNTAWRYLIYNLAGGLALLLAVAAYGVLQGTTDVLGADPGKLAPISPVWAAWIFAGFALAFLIKTPVWPLHTWMPDTYADLPPPMVAVVSGVQSKAGLYGFMVAGLTLFPGPMHAAAPLMFGLGLIGLIYGALVALVGDDLKRVVAYSSLSHLGLILLAIFSFDRLALDGALVYILAHGLFSAGLFLVLGQIETREDTRSLARLGGIAERNPRLAGGLTILALAALGLPGLAGFTGEILILTGLYHAGFYWQTVVALVPIVLAAAYMLRLFQDAMQGPPKPDLPEREDMTPLELAALAPLVAGLVMLGVAPGKVTLGADRYFAFARAASAQPATGRWVTCPSKPGSPAVNQVYVAAGAAPGSACGASLK